MPVTYAGRPCQDPAALYDACRRSDPPLPTGGWLGKANVYETANGRGPGRGTVLLTRADLDAIDLTRSHDLVFADDSGKPDRTVTLKKIVLLGGACVTPGADDDPAAVYACDVADRRHFLAKIPLDEGYNLRNPSGSGYLPATLDGTSVWTWQGVVTDLTTALGLSALTLPFSPHGAPENLAFYGGWAWEALNQVLDRIACGLDYDPTADTFSVARLGSADSAADAAVLKVRPDRVWDGRPADPTRAWRPQKVRVRFPRRPLPSDGGSPYYTVDITLATASGVESGTYVQLHDDLAALAATGTPSNSAALAVRAQERADDWLRKRTGYDRPAQIVYEGHRKVVGTTALGGTYGRVAWEDRGAGMKTELGAAPDGALERFKPDVPPAGGGGDSADGDGCCGADCAWLAGLTDADCLTATVRPNPTGLCSEIDDTQSLPLESADGVTWTSADDFATDNYVGPLTFTAGTGNDNPSLSITDGGTYEFRYLGCQGGKLAFAGGGPLVCTDGTPVDCGNAFVVLIGCGCPPPAAVQTACADHEIPSTLYAHLVLTATGCGFDTNVELVYGGVSEAPTGWGAEFTAGGCTWRFYLNHGSAGGDCWQWNLKNMETDTADGGPTTSYTADPSLIIAESQGASVLGFGETCCTYGGGGATIAYTVTE